MHRSLSTLFVITLSACVGPEIDEGSADPITPPSGEATTGLGDELAGQSGTEQPDRCEEVDRVLVSDPAQVADGFSYSVSQLLDDVATTSWQGTIAVNGEPEPAELSVSLATGNIYAVTTAFTPGQGDGHGRGAPVGDDDDFCVPFYQLPVIVRFVSGSLLDEVFPARGTSRAVDHLDYGGALAPEAVTGTTVPNFDPADYDFVELGVDGTVSAGVGHGFVAWRGGREGQSEIDSGPPCEIGNGVSGCQDPDTGICGACVGTSSPPGIFAPVGWFNLTR